MFIVYRRAAGAQGLPAGIKGDQGVAPGARRPQAGRPEGSRQLLLKVVRDRGIAVNVKI